MKIKKNNILKTYLINENDWSKDYSDLSNNHPFKILKDKLKSSWIVKKKLIESSKNLNNFNNEQIQITFDDLKQKSIITFINGTWGSGKTYFIENLSKWFDDNEKNEENKFKFNIKNKDTSLRFLSIDALEIKNANQIEEILIKFISKLIDEKEIKNLFSKYKIKKCLKKIPIDSSKLIINKISFGSIIVIEKIYKSFIKKYYLKTEEELIFNNYNEVDKKLNSISDLLEKKLEKFSNLIIIDNIERLGSKDRLEVINKILNWASLKNITFIFLTNFDKLKITSIYEEDFWNKICIFETFELENKWEIFVENYSFKNENNLEIKFSDKNNKILTNLIKEIIPIYFSNANDKMDIREIKKLFDNWVTNIEFLDQYYLIRSFLNEAYKNLSGLDKHFFINKVISLISENEEYYKLFDDEFKLSDIYLPLFNNKMLRIQSNFIKLKIMKIDNKIKFSNLIDKDGNFNYELDEESFRKFNSFIDDFASNSFKKIFNDIAITREIFDKNNLLLINFEKILLKLKIEKKELKYFEFKYNNLRKIYLYNLIFN